MNLEKVNKFFKDNIISLIVTIAILAYVSTSILFIDRTGKTLSRIIAENIFAYFFGIAISRLLSLKGTADGEKDIRVQETDRTLEGKIDEITPNIEYLGAYCEEKNRIDLKKLQMPILAGEGLSHDKINEYDFSKKEQDKNAEKIRKRKLMAVKKARKARLSKPLTVNELLSEGKNAIDKYGLGKTKQEFFKQDTATEAISKTVFAFVFGYYGVNLITDFSVAELVWKFVQTATFLLFGTMSYMKAFNFITDDLRNRKIRKINHLEAFKNTCEKYKTKEQNYGNS